MSQSNAVRARLIVEELLRCGIDQFVVASGFRSAPLALAAAGHPSAQVTVHFDERGSAFFALGYGRATRKPCVWITTSGTAVANGLPAVIESAMDEVPLICLTADRPPELRDTGANQTIDQVHIFGHYPKWFADLPAPAAEQDASFIRTTIDYGVHRALDGPVHLNCMFREPLLEKNDKDRSIPAIPWETEGAPRTLYQKEVKSVVTLDDGLLQKISNAQRGLVVSGRLQTLEEGEAISKLANHLGWPLMADICAPVPATKNSVHFFDLIVRSKPFIQRHQPDLVLHLGGPLVSKELQNFLANSSSKTYVAISPSDSRIDPAQIVTDRVQSTISGFCDSLLNIPSGNSSDMAWRDVWMRADVTARDTLSNALQKDLSEASVAWMLSDLLDSTNWVFGASSMPIRDLQAFLRRDTIVPRVFANRGASGIDGSLATAAGIAEAQPGCGTVLLGDLAMLHDVNSLNLLRERDVIIVVVNNNGGGIFHMLPVALGHEEFEKVLGTPHGMDFRWAAAQFQIPYSSVDSCEKFRETWQTATTSSGPYLIEVQTDRAQNAELHSALYHLVSKAVQGTI